MIKKYLLLTLLVLTFSSCGGSDNDPEPPLVGVTDPGFEEIYKETGCKVNDASSLKNIQPVLVAEDGSRYLTGSILINDIETFWFSKFKSNGDCVWEIKQAPAAGNGFKTRGQSSTILPNGNIVVACVITEIGEIFNAKETIPVIINTSTGHPNFIRIKEGYKYTTVRMYDNFFLCEISQHELNTDRTAYPWAVQLSYTGEIMLSVASVNSPGEFCLFLDSNEYITADEKKIERNRLVEKEDLAKWSFTPSFSKYGGCEVDLKKEGNAVLVTYTMHLSDNTTKIYRYKLDLETGEDHKVINELVLGKKDLKLQSNDTFKLLFDRVPLDTKNQQITWKSSNEDVATVNAEGVVTAKKEGKCVITLTSSVYSDVFDACEVEVIPPADDILFEQDRIVILETDEHQMKYKLYPVGATHAVKWESADSDVVSVDDKGKLTGLKVGMSRVKASINDGKISAECLVEVVSIEKYLNAGIIFWGSMTNGYVTGRMGISLRNGSTKTIQVTDLTITGSDNSIVFSKSFEGELRNLGPGKQMLQEVNFINVHEPRIIWTYRFNGVRHYANFKFQ